MGPSYNDVSSDPAVRRRLRAKSTVVNVDELAGASLPQPAGPAAVFEGGSAAAGSSGDGGVGGGLFRPATLDQLLWFLSNDHSRVVSFIKYMCVDLYCLIQMFCPVRIDIVCMIPHCTLSDIGVFVHHKVVCNLYRLDPCL